MTDIIAENEEFGMPRVIELESQYTSGVYAKRELTMVGGQGAVLYD